MSRIINSCNYNKLSNIFYIGDNSSIEQVKTYLELYSSIVCINYN